MKRSELRRRSRLRPQSRKQARRERKLAAVRLLVLERDGYRCRLCGMASTILQVHHLRMRSQGGSDEPENLVSLCAFDHRLVHDDPEWSYERGWLIRSGGGS